MKCPKCGYLGFETGDRCRNCGYDFSLTDLISSDRSKGEDQLLIKTDAETPGPPLDLVLAESRSAHSDSEVAPKTPQGSDSNDLDRMIGVPEPPGPRARPRAVLDDFPLFPSDVDTMGPLARPRAIPRPPLAVRRATPEVARVRPPQSPRLADDARLDSPALAGLGFPPDAVSADDAGGEIDATPLRRFAATLIDLLVLGVIDGVVMYLTLRLCGLDFGGITALPWAPLASFFLVLNGGYFVTFAAVGGQTIGQMAFGLKVVGDDGAPVGFNTATLRTLGWLLSSVPLGLGLWFGLRADHRTLHDRLTGTRVVRS